MLARTHGQPATPTTAQFASKSLSNLSLQKDANIYYPSQCPPLSSSCLFKMIFPRPFFRDERAMSVWANGTPTLRSVVESEKWKVSVWIQIGTKYAKIERVNLNGGRKGSCLRQSYEKVKMKKTLCLWGLAEGVRLEVWRTFAEMKHSQSKGCLTAEKKGICHQKHVSSTQINLRSSQSQSDSPETYNIKQIFLIEIIMKRERVGEKMIDKNEKRQPYGALSTIRPLLRQS